MALGTRGHWHRALHIVLFALTALLSRLTFRSVPIWILAASIFAFGFTLEYAEHVYYGVSLEWLDIADDALGCLIGLAISLLARTRTNAG
jgi:hypothetical protein